MLYIKLDSHLNAYKTHSTLEEFQVLQWIFNNSVTHIAGCLVCSLSAILKELPKSSICASDISQLSGADGQVLQQLAATDFSRSTRTIVQLLLKSYYEKYSRLCNYNKGQ